MALIASLGRNFGLSAPKAPSFGQMAALRRQRKALVRLDDAALRDMGLSRSDAQIEAKRAVWDVPPTGAVNSKHCVFRCRTP